MEEGCLKDLDDYIDDIDKIHHEDLREFTPVITALIVIVFIITGSGFWQWINSGGWKPW